MMSAHFHVKDTVTFDLDGSPLSGTITRIQNGLARIHAENGRKYDRPLAKLTAHCDASKNRTPKPEFSIDERFSFLEAMVRLVGTRKTPSCLVTGEGGLGKSFTVKSTLQASGIQYQLIKGNSTAKGLFDALNTYNGEVLVFDDCDSILEDRISRNILKGALDSYDTREVSWFNGEGLERFPFDGHIIFISNKKIDRIDQALRSRCLTVDVTMTTQEILERMQTILPAVMPDVDMEVKSEALALLKKFAYNINNLSLRSLITVITCAQSKEPNWERMALYHLTV